MSSYCSIQNPPVEFWESFWHSSEEGNHFQSYEYGEILKTASPKYKIARIGISLDGNPVGISQGTYTSYLGFGMDLRVLCGPVILTANKGNPNVVRLLIEGLEKICHNKRIVRLEVWSLESSQLREIFLKNGYSPIGKINDYVINLEGGSQKLWSSIHHNKRRNIKMAEKEGVEVIQSQSQDDIESFCLLHEAAAKRDGFSPVPRQWFYEASKIYTPELWRIFLAKWNGKSIAGIFSVSHRKTFYALRAGSLTECLRVRPNDLMHWKAMEWACANGYLKYNMGMVDEPIPTEDSTKWGIWRWKKEWNGYLERIEKFDKIILPQYKQALQARNLAYHTIKKLR